MFERKRILRYLRGFRAKIRRDSSEVHNVLAPQSNSSDCRFENTKEHQCSNKLECSNALDGFTSINVPSDGDNIGCETEKIQERAVIQDNKSEQLLNVCVPDKSNLRIDTKHLNDVEPTSCPVRVFLMHTNADYELALKLAFMLRENGFLVILSGDIQDNLRANHCKVLIAVQKEVDFTVPVITATFLDQIHRSGRIADRGDDLESQANCFMYDLALKEFSRSYCINYRVRPVCVSCEVANCVGGDPILQWCFQLWDEIMDLFDNLKSTKNYLLSTGIQSSKYKKIVSEVDSSKTLSSKQASQKKIKPNHGKISTENNSNLGEIIIKQQPHAHEKIPQGLQFFLNCVAISECLPLHYQWYKDCKAIEGERSSILMLKDLYPDPETGKKEFQYYCEISNEYKKVNSLTAIVKLTEVTDTTKFVAENKVALLIANDAYEVLENLGSPAADAAELAVKLQKMDFQVIVVKNLSKKEMEHIIHAFCSLLKPQSYALFFFAGHGLEEWGQTYLLPVDCSREYLQKETICKEYILECMQRERTALNVLLIDCCRTFLKTAELPRPVVVSMENNTVYGYATTFLSGAYEEERGESFFVKYLKKYICSVDLSIQEVLLRVQRDCASESSITQLQNPVIESSLSVPRKLCDDLRNTTGFLHTIPWKTSQGGKIMKFLDLNCTIILAIKDHMDVYLNGIDIYAWLDVEEDADLDILLNMEVNIELSSVHLQVSPPEGTLLDNIDLKTNCRTILFRKSIFGLQKMRDNILTGNLFFIIGNNVIRESNFSFKLEKVDNMRFFHL